MIFGPGSRIRHSELREPGTLACVLRPKDLTSSKRYLLSAAHVLNPGGFGERSDDIDVEVGVGQWKTIAKLDDWTPINGLSQNGIEIDAAIAELLPEFASTWLPVSQAVAPSGIAGFVYPSMELRVFGAQTGRLTEAELRSSEGEILVDYRQSYSDLPVFAMKVRAQVFYGRNMGGWHSVTTGGDSGALVVDRFGLAVGIHIGSTTASSGLNVSVCTPMQRILDRFDLTLDIKQDNVAGGAATSPSALPVDTQDGVGSTVPASTGSGSVSGAAPTADYLAATARDTMGIRILPLLQPHRYEQGVIWQLTPRGVIVGGLLPRTGGEPITVAKIWTQFGTWISESANKYQVPVELIVATICTETHGNPLAIRMESRNRMSVGLMQTLIGTAQDIMCDVSIDRAWLEIPENSIEAGTAYIANERRNSQLDPPLVAAIYNSGHLRPANNNRWQFAQNVSAYAHVDAYVEWFNDCFGYFDKVTPDLPSDVPSFWKLLKV